MRDTICHAEFCPHQKGFTVKSLEINGGQEKCYPNKGKACLRGNNCPHQTERTIQQFHAILIGEKSVIIAKAN